MVFLITSCAGIISSVANKRIPAWIYVGMVIAAVLLDIVMIVGQAVFDEISSLKSSPPSDHLPSTILNVALIVVTAIFSAILCNVPCMCFGACAGIHARAVHRLHAVIKMSNSDTLPTIVEEPLNETHVVDNTSTAQCGSAISVKGQSDHNILKYVNHVSLEMTHDNNDANDGVQVYRAVSYPTVAEDAYFNDNLSQSIYCTQGDDSANDLSNDTNPQSHNNPENSSPQRKHVRFNTNDLE